MARMTAVLFDLFGTLVCQANPVVYEEVSARALDVLLPKRLGISTILLDRERQNKCKLVDAVVSNLNEAMETIIKKSSES